MMEHSGAVATRASSAAEPYQVFLDPAQVRLFRDHTGRLRLTIEGDRSFLEVKVVRAFPLSRPDYFWAVLNALDRDKVIGVIKDPSQMDKQSREAAIDALNRYYFMPIIRRIISLREEYGAIYCDVETDRGRRQFVCKGLRDSLEDLGEGELIIPDVDGNRYRIPNWEALDPRSRRLLQRIV